MDFPEFPGIRALSAVLFLFSHHFQNINAGLSAEHMQVRWFRTGFDSLVHLYENGMDQNQHQLPEYKGRTELIRADISNGSVSLRIRNVGLHDEGRYTCFFRFGTNYDEATLELKVAVMGSALSIFVNDHQDRGIRVVCESTGWYPEPNVTWRREDGQSLTSLFETETKQQNDLFNVSTSLLLRTNQYRKVSCHMRNTVLNQEQELSISVSDAFFHRVSRWMISLSILLLSVLTPCGLLVALVVHHLRKESKERARLSADVQSLSAELEWRRCRSYAVAVTLDPETAYPTLILSEDRKSVGRGETRQDVPDVPQRFDYSCCVLGSERFTSGRHYWEVEVGEETGWEVGMCQDSVNRKREVRPSPEEGYCVVRQRNEGAYLACTSPSTPLPLSVRPRAVGILLDCEAGKVSFYNADEKSLLFTFTHTLTGTLLPFFYPYRIEGVLKIRAVPAWE
ncbi:butyrophilin subfamily 1 member A1-like isoform X2 [Rhinatrema bivittatum]|uniref:butyrophilin subfamily 1 member A1-like isoform X2 n=1 Tax=Rhinatrema bivittatum TaxID=194408 RepID=UPI001129F718|nr:butyrophilin subfamily 1 member A1-like isoform X2 [Rhinatrema bivittatum]